jgi:hypothetical protein
MIIIEALGTLAVWLVCLFLIPALMLTAWKGVKKLFKQGRPSKASRAPSPTLRRGRPAAGRPV